MSPNDALHSDGPRVARPAGERGRYRELADLLGPHVPDARFHRSATIGLADHQRLSAAHVDTRNLHLHIAINKVHPDSFRCVEPYYDHLRLDAACRELEERHGLQRDNRIQDGRQRRSRSMDMEAHAGEESLLAWIRKNASRAVSELVSATAGWQDAHRLLAGLGLELVPRGAGLVIRDRASGVSVRASHVERGLSAQALTRRWGPYEPPGPEAQATRPAVRYQKGPVHRHPDSARLYTEFQRERQAALEARKAAREVLEAQLRLEAERLRAWYAKRRAHVRAGRQPRLQKLSEYRRLSLERRADLARHRQAARERRARVVLEHPLLTWQDHLCRRAEGGDPSALAVLRSRRQKEQTLANALLCASGPEEARHILLEHLRPSVRKDGVVIYQLPDGSLVRDEQRRVSVREPTEAAVLLGLLLARERFGDRRLTIHGDEEFRRQVAALAGSRGLDVRFADAALEQARQAAMKERGPAAAPSALDAFIEKRNGTRQKVQSILPHRAWTAEDHGRAIYRGRRRLADGSEAVLLERDGEMLVKIVDTALAASSSQWKPADSVALDVHGQALAPPDRRARGGRT